MGGDPYEEDFGGTAGLCVPAERVCLRGNAVIDEVKLHRVGKEPFCS